MAFQDIANLLLSEAKETAGSLLSAAKDQASEIIDSAKTQADANTSDTKKIAETQKASIEKKSKTQQSQLERSLRSAMQQGIVEDVYTELKVKLVSASADEKIKLFSGLISSISEEKGTIISLGEDEKVLKKAIKEAGKKFSVDSVKDSSLGGFSFAGEGFDMDFSFDSLIKSAIRPKYESEIFQKLFA